MNLTRVEVSNFKGIDSLAFAPGQVTLLTGRNNSGKTSLLEAVELTVDPSRIEQYGERVESLIAAGAESAEIVVEYEDGGDMETRALELRVPENVEVATLIADRVGKTNRQQSVIVDRLVSILEVPGQSVLQEETLSEVAEVIGEEVQTAVRNEWREHPKETAAKTVQIDIGADSHTYVYVDELPRDFVDNVTGTAAAAAVERLDQQTTDSFEKQSPWDDILVSFEHCVDNFVRYRLRDGHLFAHRPAKLASVGFRDELALTADEIDLGENDGAIRLSNIEEYLIDNGLAENLDTLSLDQMVYEEDGEKYQVPYEFVGEGFKTLLGLLWELWEDTPELLLLEEPETHMHPRYVHEFVHWFVDVVRDRGVQVFLTTHDIDTIRSFFDFVEPSQKAFLREEFRLLQMDQTLPESYDYDEAESLSKELQTDLRGI